MCARTRGRRAETRWRSRLTCTRVHTDSSAAVCCNPKLHFTCSYLKIVSACTRAQYAALCRPNLFFVLYVCMLDLEGVYAPTTTFLIRTHINARRALFCEGHTNFMAPFYSAADSIRARVCVCVLGEMTGLDSLNLLFSLSLSSGRGWARPLISVWEGLWLPHPSARLCELIYILLII